MRDSNQTKWDARYLAGNHPRHVSPFLLEIEPLLPRKGNALDLAGGAGRHALWLARRGLRVTLIDISVAALDLAGIAAKEAGVLLSLARIDLGREEVPDGPWDLIVCFHFLMRSLYPQLPRLLAPGGLFVCEQATRRNLERHRRPAERYLLDDGELPSRMSGLEILHHEEGWLDEGKHDVRLLARRPS